MPNYLQRVLTSGARTTSSAKPLALGRPLLPPVKAPVWTPMGEVNLPAFEGADLEKPADHAGSSAEHHTSSAAAPDWQTQEPDVSRNEGTKKSLVLPKQPPPKDESVSDPEAGSAHTDVSRESVSKSAERPPPAEGVSAAPAAATRIRAPKGLRRTGAGNDRHPAIAHAIEQKLSALAPRAAKASVESATSSPTPIAREPIIAGAAPVVSTAIVRAPTEERIAIGPELQTARKQETHFFEVPVKPPQPAARPALPASSDNRRRSQISIGRIDVQVNNVPAAADPVPRSTRSPGYSNFLEARYLNRFSLKP